MKTRLLPSILPASPARGTIQILLEALGPDEEGRNRP